MANTETAFLMPVTFAPIRSPYQHGFGFDDLFALCADLSNQFNIHNQRWAFRDGMLKLKQEYCRTVLKDSALADKIDLDAPIPFKFARLQNYLHNLNMATYDSSTDALALETGENEEWCE